ncbi:MAG: hypothetical protein C0613_02335 [Desulfobulbaceae bacterium]|nr:MAG: hypothetical protein C0613_02335 [Desulfobulbaceae bacterium]
MNRVSILKFIFLPLLVGSLCGLLLTGTPHLSLAGPEDDSGQCCTCHSEVCRESAGRLYVHAPVAEKRCVVCHGRSRSSEEAGVRPVAYAAGQEDVQEDDEIDWFTKDCRERTTHWFKLPGNAAGRSLIFMARANGRKILARQIVLPELAQVEPLPMAEGDPTIFDVRVMEVKRGVFLSARIAWKTDRLTDARLLYGVDELDSSTAVVQHLATRHEITITGLQAKQTYQVVALGRDVLGNEARSAPLLLSTAKAFREPEFSAPHFSGEELEVDTAYYRHDERLFARFSTNYPVAIRLGRHGNGQPFGKNSDREEKRIPVGHPQLADPYTLAITVCVECHPQAKGVQSHPVDVGPKADMTIPADYSTMPDGRLSCMSCHQAHASDHEYRLTRARRKDLCLGCHRNFG